MPASCPTCGNREEEPLDYDVVGNDRYTCGACGTQWAVDQATKEQVIIDVV